MGKQAEKMKKRRGPLFHGAPCRISFPDSGAEPEDASSPAGEGGADLLKTAAVQPVEPPVNHQIEQ